MKKYEIMIKGDIEVADHWEPYIVNDEIVGLKCTSDNNFTVKFWPTIELQDDISGIEEDIDTHKASVIGLGLGDMILGMVLRIEEKK